MADGDGIAFTLVLSRAALDNPRFITRLPVLAAVVVARELRRLASASVPITVKWPNDVHIGGRKVAGILAESLDTDRVGIGIGINLNGKPAELPADSVTSLAEEGIVVDADVIVQSIADGIVEDARTVDDDEPIARLVDELDTMGKRVRLELPDGRRVTGVVTDEGLFEADVLPQVVALIHELVAGDVTHLRHADG